MLRHLRLARLRGSLVAPNSPVQDRALEYLDMLDGYEDSMRRRDMVKGLLVHRDVPNELLVEQFPEYFLTNPFEAATDEDGEFDPDLLDEDQLDWRTDVSLDEDEALSRWIAERENGATFTGADFE